MFLPAVRRTGGGITEGCPNVEFYKQAKLLE